jgi:hypothetical protein
MTIYETDTLTLLVWSGTAWVGVSQGWSGDNLSVPGTLSVTGNTTLSGNASVGGTASVAGNSLTVGGFQVSRLVDGKVSPSTGNTGAVTTTAVAIPNANAQNVPVIQDRVYRATGFVSALSSVAADRGALELWNGAPGSTKLGGSVNIRFTTANNFQSYPFGFVWRAPSTTTIANLNLSIVRISGTGTLEAQTDGNYFMVVEELGSANLIGNL